jgi:signal transduction histidine kinase
VAVALTIAVLAGVAALAAEAARRDRAALVRAFSDEHLFRLRIAIREIESDLAGVRQHLEFAARLVDVAPGADQRRELEALLAVVRAYRMIVVYDLDGRERVVAMDPLASSSWSRAPFTQALRATARAATTQHVMAISEPLGDASSPWYRAFATPLSRNGLTRGALVILVDQKSTFERLRLVAPEASAKLMLLGPHGRSTPLTDPALDVAHLETNAALREIVRRMHLGHTGSHPIGQREAVELGLGEAAAVAVYAPIRTEDAGHWAVAVLDSTSGLESQEHAIFLRMAVLAAVFTLALGALSVYLVVSARRAIAVQERLRVAEEIGRLREKAERMLENVPFAVVALDEDGVISGINVAAREQVPPAAVGQPLARAFAQAGADAVATLQELVQDARASGGVRRILAEPLALAGRERFFAIHAIPLAHPVPDIRLLLVLEDVTELQVLSSQLLRAEKLATVGVLAAGIAHEVGTPLGVVRGRAELIAQKLGPDHPAGGSADVIVEEIDRISRTIQQLLDFSRVSRAPAEPVSLASVAGNVVELLAFEARTRKVQTRVDIPPGIELAANADQLKQVLVNLVLNALHACPSGGHVTIRATANPSRGTATLEIVDDGAGIPDSLVHRVFDPFFTTKKRGKGTGLGLTVAAQIVRNHGGEIDLDSEVGRGTTVVVSWPLALQPEAHDGEAERRAHSGG